MAAAEEQDPPGYWYSEAEAEEFSDKFAAMAAATSAQPPSSGSCSAG